MKSVRMSAGRWVLLAVVCLAAAALTAVACSSDTPKGIFATGTNTNVGGAGAAPDGGTGNGGDLFDGGGVGCTGDKDCDGGVCLDGMCCASAELACDKLCCNQGEVCLFGGCVLPGDPCVSEADCPDDHYCEPALGEGSGGGGQGGDCTQPLESGKCLPLPPLCDEIDGGADAGDCIEKCEYHPPPGQLNAVVKWQWGYDPKPTEYPDFADVWATPTVGRIYDANCDGKVDLADPPNVIFVSGDAKTTCCSCGGYKPSTCLTGVLRMLDGKSGQEIWSLRKAEESSIGFAGMSVALGDVDGDKHTDIVAMTGEGKIAVIDSLGQVLRLSTEKTGGYSTGAFGWGGGIAVADMNGDGFPEIAYGNTLFTTQGVGVTRKWVGSAGNGGGSLNRALSYFVDLNNDGQLELLAGRTAYKYDGSTLWNNSSHDGFTAVADFDGDSKPEVVVVSGGQLRILEGETGQLELGPVNIPGSGNGGPPTIADFNGDQQPEIGAATATYYSMFKPDYMGATIKVLWSQTNHDNSSSVTGSSVFDFEGDGKAEVIYADECFLWVYDGFNGDVLFTANTQSFTATEASMVADLDGDGHAEIIIMANGANTNSWHCAHHTDPNGAYPVWSKPPNAPAYRGLTVLGDSANSWVGTRTLWNQHAYYVTHVCDPRDSACLVGSYYGEIPDKQQKNWTVPWLNNFRQNVQDKGLFDAPDATVALEALCESPVPLEVAVRNIGLAGLPADVQVGVYAKKSPDVLVATTQTTKPLLPGQTEIIKLEADAMLAGPNDTFVARIEVDPNNPTFHECRDDNNESALVTPNCVQ